MWINKIFGGEEFTLYDDISTAFKWNRQDTGVAEQIVRR